MGCSSPTLHCRRRQQEPSGSQPEGKGRCTSACGTDPQVPAGGKGHKREDPGPLDPAPHHSHIPHAPLHPSPGTKQQNMAPSPTISQAWDPKPRRGLVPHYIPVLVPSTETWPCPPLYPNLGTPAPRYSPIPHYIPALGPSTETQPPSSLLHLRLFTSMPSHTQSPLPAFPPQTLCHLKSPCPHLRHLSHHPTAATVLGSPSPKLIQQLRAPGNERELTQGSQGGEWGLVGWDSGWRLGAMFWASVPRADGEESLVVRAGRGLEARPPGFDPALGQEWEPPGLEQGRSEPRCLGSSLPSL